MIFQNKRLIKGVLQLVARWNLPRLAAYLLHFMSQPVPCQLASFNSTGPKYCALVLSINKSGFLEDVEEGFLEADDFDLIFWPPLALRAFATALLSPSLHNNRYVTDDPTIEASKARYRNFLIQTWKHFCMIRPTHAVISANFHYFVQREFAAALEEVGTPFIVLHKENLKSPGRVEFWRFMYKRRGTFAGRKILAYNEIERELQISTGVIDPQKVVVTGMPRMDRVHRWRRKHAGNANGSDRPQLLFFAFDKKDKLPAGQHRLAEGTIGNMPEVSDQWGDLTWNGFCEETHRAIFEFACRRPDVQVIVKIKGIERQRTEVVEMLKSDGELPSNLAIVIGGDPFQLLTETHVVVGFNTTGLLEAIAAGKPVIVPRYGEALDYKARDFAIDLGDAVDYAHSPDEIIDLACRYVDGGTTVPSELSSSAMRALRQWTGNDDGAAGRRVLAAIRAELSTVTTDAVSPDPSAELKPAAASQA